MQNAALYKKGMKTRQAVLGMQREQERANDEDAFSLPFREFTTKYVWGEIWSRKGLPVKTRCLVNIALMTAIKAQGELKSHVRGAILNGCSKAEIREVLLQCAPACGVPARRDALRTTRLVFAEMDKKK